MLQIQFIPIPSHQQGLTLCAIRLQSLTDSPEGIRFTEERMRAMLKYKGYTGQLDIDIETGMLCGRVLDIKDVVTFKGETVEEARRAFEESINDYLEWCEELGEEPDKPFSGRLPFRTSPEQHRKIVLAATKSGKSINTWMDGVLAKEANRLVTI